MRGRQALGLAAFVVAALALAGCASLGARPAVSPQAGPGGVYLRAAGNAPEIERFLDRYPEGTEMRRAAEFLAANLPLSDALSMNAEALSEHVDYAFLAREAFPWGEEVPFEVFLRFVVPHRMSQEPVEPYRAKFFGELTPRLRGARTVREAVNRVNAWCFEKAGFEPSSAQDQGPLTTIARGRGRCEELGILLVAALRSVGIPARPCSTPYWRHVEGNHLWVEIYDRGKWRFIGAAEPESDYDLAWFEPVLHTVPFIYSVAYGAASEGLEGDGQALVRRRETIINRTRAYAPKGVLAVAAVKGGEPLPGLNVALHTYNFAAPRAFALAATRDGGEAEMDLGPGVYLLTAASGNGRDYAFVEVRPGRRTTAVLNLDRDRVFEGGAFMPFEVDGNLRSLIAEKYRQAQKKAQKRINRLEKARKRRMAETLGAARRAVSGQPEEIAQALAHAGLNAPEVARALVSASDERQAALVQLIQGMDAKDLAQCRASELVANVELAANARAGLAGNGILAYGDAIYAKYVLPERVLHEPYAHWRSGLASRFAAVARAESLDAIVAGVRRAVGELSPVEPGRLGTTPSPELVFASGLHRQGRRDADMAAVAAFRALGVPARATHDWPRVEYHDGAKWQVFQAAAEKPPHGLEAYAGQWAELAVAFTLNGEPVPPDTLTHARDFALCRLDENLGFVGLDAVGVTVDEKAGRVVLSFPAGERWLSSGRRDKQGRPYFRMERFMLEPGERREVARELALPQSPVIPEDAFQPAPAPRAASR